MSCFVGHPVSNNFKNYGRRHSKLFTNCHFAGHPLSYYLSN